MRQEKKRSETHARSVYNTLKEEICTGIIRTDEILSEAKIAARLGVSRTPVREALTALESEGLVEIKRGIGANVKPLSLQDVIHIYELRKVLELLAAQTAVQHITKEELKACRKNFKALLKYENEPQQQIIKYCQVDWDLHMLIIQRCENPYIGSMMNLLIPNIRRLQVICYRPERCPISESVNQHLELIDALEGRDIENIRVHLEAHLNWSLADFITSSTLF